MHLRAKAKRFPTSEVQVSSEKIARDLTKLGVTPRKSLSAVFPRWLSRQLESHFVRGLSDGDGITAYMTKGIPQVNLGFCGTKAVVTAVEAILFRRCNRSRRVAISTNGTSGRNWRVQYRGIDDVQRIMAFLIGEGGAFVL